MVGAMMMVSRASDVAISKEFKVVEKQDNREPDISVGPGSYPPRISSRHKGSSIKDKT